ncbi:hypothetical protein AVEN_235715-1 [Araneus ventricosus]|uniref:Uncharacterized protein n=1 Tax=Araneus ventricosus TaxID=182803 RepID=A0A4Y2UCW9_ARAVE|nr:hypothetical protein AVEN_235715-1 [Araneus ventricosus]
MAVQNSNLPPSSVNEVVKIVEDETIVRSNLKSVSHVYSWIEEYGRTSDTKWNLRSSRPSGTRLVCCFIVTSSTGCQQGLPHFKIKLLGSADQSMKRGKGSDLACYAWSESRKKSDTKVFKVVLNVAKTGGAVRYECSFG